MKKKKQNVKNTIIAIVIVIICLILLDSGITFLLKKHPILSYKESLNEKEYVIHGFFYNIYGCRPFDILQEEWAPKTKKLECGESIVVIKESFLNYKEYRGYFFEHQKTQLIRNKEELKLMADRVPSFEGKYGNTYFKDKSLIVVYVPLSSGSISTKLDSVSFADPITVKINKDVPEVGTTDMSGVIYFIEVNNNVINSNKVKVEIS